MRNGRGLRQELLLLDPYRVVDFPADSKEEPMKFMINFTHIDGAWEKLTPNELENIQAQHKEFVRVLEEEQNTRMTFFKPAAEAKTVRRRED